VHAKADSEHWRRKYFDALKSLEQEERSFRSLENLLRRIVSRLGFATMGLSSRLDAEVSRLSVAMRSKASEAELEKLFTPLSDAIAALDSRSGSEADPGATTVPGMTPTQAPGFAIEVAAQPTSHDSAATSKAASSAPPPAEAIFGDDRVRAILNRLLTLIRRDSALTASAGEIESQLAISLTREQLPIVLSDIADLLNRRVTSVEREKREIEGLLSQITARLDELTQYMLGESAERKLSLESTEEFNSRLAADMHELGSSVESSADLVQVKLKVRARLDTISSQIQEFRVREESRSRSAWDRSEMMRERVERLEGEARNLHDKLRDEQRLSMVDALTQIPNRLAYDQRLAEEFKRWERFRQPTCIATWDIDHFKNVNDAYGHRAGDKVLRIVAECLAGRVRDTDFVARYGGEEFVMILAGTLPEAAIKVVNEIRETVANLGFHFRGVPVSVSISCGVTAFREGDSADDAFDRTDKALYAAKAGGRNRCVLG
jgi:diguanylate cyclase